MLEDKIKTLIRDIIQFAILAEGMIGKSIEGLLKRQKTLLTDVIEKDEPKANASEIMIDEQCVSLIAQYQPKAKDLRIILMVFTMNADLERIGDHAVNIAENGLYLIKRPPVKPLIDIPRMADIVGRMLNDSINAFINNDPLLANSVCERDQVVDGIMEQLLRELVTFMGENPKIIDRSIRLLGIGRNLERIADLSTNISEDVIYMVEGRVIKHHLGQTKESG